MEKIIVPSKMDASIDTVAVMLQFHPLTTKQCKTMEAFVEGTISLPPVEVHFNGKTINLEQL